jgi:hypothetical protein
VDACSVDVLDAPSGPHEILQDDLMVRITDGRDKPIEVIKSERVDENLAIRRIYAGNT